MSEAIYLPTEESRYQRLIVVEARFTELLAQLEQALADTMQLKSDYEALTRELSTVTATQAAHDEQITTLESAPNPFADIAGTPTTGTDDELDEVAAT